MNPKKLEIPIFTMREFLRSPKQAAALLEAGQEIQVTKNGKPLFTAKPTKPKGATIKDFAHIKFSGNHGPDLSKQVDEIVYGN